MTEKRIIEENVRFSESIMWEQLRNAYMKYGPEAWTEKKVPSYITSNSRSASIIAHIIAGFIQDNLGENAPLPIDMNHPLYLFDLGAGSGRFSYLFLRKLLTLIPRGLQVRFILTDIVKDNLESWRKHPQFQDWIADGILDFALYDADQSEAALFLEQRQSVLTAATMHNPVILIGNYFFDSIRADLLHMNAEGALEEVLLTVTLPPKEEAAEMTPEEVVDISCAVSTRPIPSRSSVYPQSHWNSIFETYKDCKDLFFSIPTGALKVLDFFSELSNKKVFFVVSDQGQSTLDHVKTYSGQLDKQIFAYHTTFSLPVNYHALQSYLQRQGGCLFIPNDPTFRFVIVAGTPHAPDSALPLTEWNYRQRVEPFDSIDYLDVLESVKGFKTLHSVPYLISFFHLMGDDAIALNTLLPKLRTLIHGCEKEWPALAEIIMDAWKGYFWLTKEEGLFVESLGNLLQQMGMHQEAKKLYASAEQIKSHQKP